MSMLKMVGPNTIITGWDFSTGAVKCLAFDIQGNVLASSRFPTDLVYGDSSDPGAIELNLTQLEGQARATTRAIAEQLRDLGRLQDWAAGGISATHHTSGRIDRCGGQVRRAICWNDQTLGQWHEIGLKRLGGQERVQELIGGPWAVRYSLSHLVKDEAKLSEKDWRRTARIVCHGSLAAGFLTGNFDTISISGAASTGIMDLRTGEWRKEMLDAIESPEYRELAWNQLPDICSQNEPVGALSDSLKCEIQWPEEYVPPFIFPTSDDQQAGLIGGGAVKAGQMAIVLGNSAVVNSSSKYIPDSSIALDVMALNWGPFLLMRCYSNGAYFIDRIIGKQVDYAYLEQEARKTNPTVDSVQILPFIVSEPSLGINEPRLEWVNGTEPENIGEKYRACLEALAFLIALGVEEHKKAGQAIKRITVSGGTAQSRLMCEILASTLNWPLERLVSSEGPALGAAVTALAALENYRRFSGPNSFGTVPGLTAFPWLQSQEPDTEYTPADAVKQMVQFKDTIEPVASWIPIYQKKLSKFKELIQR